MLLLIGNHLEIIKIEIIYKVFVKWKHFTNLKVTARALFKHLCFQSNLVYQPVFLTNFFCLTGLTCLPSTCEPSAG